MSARWMPQSLTLMALALPLVDGPAGARQDAKAPPPVELTAEQDHRRLMELLGIQELRPGANPRDPQAPNAVNYDESKANPYPDLPDPLLLKNGKRVKDGKIWWDKRRREIVEDFDREIYGRVPKDTQAPAVKSSPAAPALLAAPALRVALTFDDLPVHASLPPGLSRADVARSILGALEAHQAPPTYGFVNAKALVSEPDTAEVLRLWRAAGHPLANHAFSHMDLHTNTAEAFEQDVLANEPTLREYMGTDGWRFLRYPFLHEGDTLEKRRAVRSFLVDHGYKVAQVTMNFDDYAYNDPYTRCLPKNDLTAIDGLKDSYLRRAAESLTFAQQASALAYGRDIPHVMLLHIGAFETVMFPRLLDLLQQRGFRLVTLDEAQNDDAYASDPNPPVPSGGTLLDQVMAAKRITPPAGPPADELGKIAGLCR